MLTQAQVHKLFPYGWAHVNQHQRGTKPIYLHIIHPILKPFTSTLDTLLELLLMIGDSIFALFAFPIKRLRLALYYTFWIGENNLYVVFSSPVKYSYLAEFT